MTVSTYLPGPAPSALSFAGDDWVEIPSANILPHMTQLGNYTVETWVNVIPGTTPQAIFNLGPTDNRHGATIEAGILRFGRHNSVENYVRAGVNISAGWHHIALINSNGAMSVLIDGEPGVPNTGGLYLGTLTSTLFLGRNASTNLNYLVGSLDDFRIWNHVRTVDQIQANMHRELVGNEPGLVGYWKFNEAGLNPVTANFVGKVSGSTVANPHVSRYKGAIALEPPSGVWTEAAQTIYDGLYAIDGTLSTISTLPDGRQAQHLFSFDLIQLAIRERAVPLNTMTTAEAVAWLKANIRVLSMDWYGFGSGASGSLATVKLWTPTGWSASSATTTNSTVTKVNYFSNASNVDNNGFVHYLAYAPASDGTIASIINTDYVELYVEFVNTAINSVPGGANGTIVGASYTTDAPELAFGIDTKTDWTIEDVVSAEDFNRIEGNTRVCREYLTRLQYAIPGLVYFLSRDITYIDFLDEINRIENNIKTIKDNFLTPEEWGGSVTWVVGKGFLWSDMNRIEENILLLMRYANRVADSVIRCGAWTSGMEMGAV